jgi:hypothetical protein
MQFFARGIPKPQRQLKTLQCRFFVAFQFKRKNVKTFERIEGVDK